jgi:hypothetical protein
MTARMPPAFAIKILLSSVEVPYARSERERTRIKDRSPIYMQRTVPLIASSRRAAVAFFCTITTGDPIALSRMEMPPADATPTLFSSMERRCLTVAEQGSPRV